jgi:3-phenylpropionate/trans-cinnamate dioxygenase ferredoxin component
MSPAIPSGPSTDSLPGYVRACALTDVPDEAVVGVDVEGTAVAVARTGGRVHAVADSCTHEQVPLSEGEVYDGMLECWLHGACFRLSTGEALELPATTALTVYETAVVDGDVYVRLDPGAST